MPSERESLLYQYIVHLHTILLCDASVHLHVLDLAATQAKVAQDRATFHFCWPIGKHCCSVAFVASLGKASREGHKKKLQTVCIQRNHLTFLANHCDIGWAISGTIFAWMLVLDTLKFHHGRRVLSVVLGLQGQSCDGPWIVPMTCDF